MLRSVLVRTAFQPKARRIRHLHCPVLWLQERVGSGEIRIEKHEGEHSTADIGTKAVSAPVLMKHLKR